MPDPARRYEWDNYLYPPDETGQRVLRNKLEVASAPELAEAERRLTALRALELTAQPELVERTFDAVHWQAIHRHLFQDVYEWAGEFRTVNMAKADSLFVHYELLDQWCEKYLSSLRSPDAFSGAGVDEVVGTLSRTLQTLNLIHPFREGNGRCQRIFIEHVADYAGYTLDWNKIGTLEQTFLMQDAHNGDLEPLKAALTRALDAGHTAKEAEASNEKASPVGRRDRLLGELAQGQPTQDPDSLQRQTDCAQTSTPSEITHGIER